MNLADLQAAFVRLAMDPAAMSDADDLEPGEARALAALQTQVPDVRLETYQQLVAGALHNTLERCYTRCSEHLGQGWSAAARAYFDACPPTHWDLNQAVIDFPHFLEALWLPAHPELPAWLLDLAEYERAELQAYLSEAGPPAGGSVELPRVNPTLEVLILAYDVAGWIFALEASVEEGHDSSAGAEHEAPGRSGETPRLAEPVPLQTVTAIYRDPHTLRCRFLKLTPLAALTLDRWSEGMSSSSLAEQLAPQLGLSFDACLEQLQLLAHSLAHSKAVSIA